MIDREMLTLVAPLSGVLVPLDQVPDPVFAQRLVGDGISIDPLSQTLLAPCDAQVVQIHRAGHALTLSASGLEIVIHIGLDTVMLQGEGFASSVKAGDLVCVGDPLMTFDADFIATHARSLLTPILVTNMDRVVSLQPRAGRVAAGRDVLMDVILGAALQPPATQEKGDTIESAPIVIASETGLHARPAAVLAAAARKFTSDVRLVREGREANARSVVSIMALEVAGGDTVTIVARGDDAGPAIAAISRVLTTDISPSHSPTLGVRSTALRVEALRATPGSPASGDRALRGVPASPGVVLGQVFQLRHDDAIFEQRAADPNHERRALDAAIASAHVQLEALQARLATEADTDRAAIFAAHQELLEDPEVLDSAAAHIRGGATAAYAWHQAYTAQVDRLLALRNQLLAARAADMRDVGRRVVHLLVGRDDAPRDMPPESIVVAE
ncbi:MAG: glucose PTS transporter subunit IIA, partial [Gemmatimonadota bacterium]|nr:glucose PTS transporter subunit IIA [Gemmatimonadota bacterium]